MKETFQGTALLVAVTCGFLAWSLAGANPSWAQDKEALDICLNSEREPSVRVEACRTAAEQGDAEAQFSLGVMYYYGEGVSQDYGEAVKWYRLAAEQGLASAQVDLGSMYEYGRGVPQDDGEAVKWFRLATEQGNASAQYRLGVMYRIGEGVPQDDGEAVKWYRLAAEQGNVWARIALAHICLDRERELGVRVEACHIAAEQGNAEAQFQPRRTCIMWVRAHRTTLKRSSGTGWPPRRGTSGARVTVARICLDPEREPVVRAEACRTAAEQGGAGAQFNLGVRYSTGEGVPQDDGEAVKWYRLAADQGDASAQLNLGNMYSNGEGVPQDYAEAVKWYRLAAEQGYALAQSNLGNMYYNGEGVPQDYAEAVKWYRLAAEQGHALAQSNLGFMYYNGEGVPQNYIQAHMWLNLAGARGNEKARKDRDIVKDKMTPEQIAEAQRLASVWKPGMVIDAPAQMSELPSDGDALQQWDDDGNGRITCAEARRHGLAPVHRGHPAYSYMRDPDNDGIVCK